MVCPQLSCERLVRGSVKHRQTDGDSALVISQSSDVRRCSRSCSSLNVSLQFISNNQVFDERYYSCSRLEESFGILGASQKCLHT